MMRLALGWFVLGCLLCCGSLSAQTGDRPNRVLRLDETGHLELPVVHPDDSGALTVEFWARWEGVGGTTTLFSFGDEGRPDAVVTTERRTGDLALRVPSEGRDLVRIESLIRPKEWTHLAVAFEPGQVGLYVNGWLAGTNRSSIAPGNSIQIGRPLPGPLGTDGFNGMLDEIRIWSRSLTETEIRANRFARLAGSEEGLMGLWHFDGETAESGVELGDGASVIVEPRPVEGGRPEPMIVRGRVTVGGEDSEGVGAEAVVEMVLRHAGRVLGKAECHPGASFAVALRASPGSEVEVAAGVRAGAEEWSRLRVYEQVTFQSGSLLPLDLHLQATPQISGRVLDMGGHGQADVIVQVVRPGPAGAEGEVVRSARTGASGEYAFWDLPSADYRVRCGGLSGWLFFGEGRVLALTKTGVLDGLDFELPRVHRGLWRHFRKENGLAGNGVRGISFAPDGTVWLATAQGASRFDGETFRNLTQLDGLLDTRLSAIHVDREGVVWMGSGRGVTRYDPVSGEGPEAFRHVTVRDGLEEGEVRSVVEGEDGAIWVTAGRGLSRVDGESVRTYREGNGEVWGVLGSLAAGPGGVLWFGSEGGKLWRFDGTSFRGYGPGEGVRARPRAAPHVDRNGAVWFADSGSSGVSRMTLAGGDPGEVKVERFGPGAGLVPANYDRIRTDGRGVAWIGTSGTGESDEGGAFRMEDGGTVVFSGRSGLEAGSVNDIELAADGTVWFATDDGVAVYDPWTVLTYTADDGLRARPVTCLAAGAEGGLWVGSGRRTAGGEPSTGLDFFDGERFESGVREGQSVRVLDSDGANGLWAVEEEGGLIRLQGKEWVRASGQGRSMDPVTRLSGAADGTYWLGTPTGELWHYDPRSGGGRILEKRLLAGTNRAPVVSVYCDREGGVWAGVMATGERDKNGTVLRMEGEEVRSVRVADHSAIGTVYDIGEGPEGAIWCATETGLLAYRKGGPGALERFPESMLNEPMRCLFKDRSGAFWIGTAGGGVLRFDGRFWSEFDTRDGLLGNRVTAICQDTSGAMWFGGGEGLTRYRLPPKRPPPAPIVVVSGADSGGDPSLPLRAVQENPVTFEFKGIDLRNGARSMRYRHQLVQAGQPISEPGWSGWGREPEQGWTPPAPGEFEFAVQAMDRDGNVSEPAVVRVSVGAHWYLNPAVTVPAALVLLGLIGASAGSTWRLLKRRKEALLLKREMDEQEARGRRELESQKEALEEARNQAESANRAKALFLANMSDEIRTPMNAILGYSQILKRDRQLPDEHRQSLETIEKSSDHLLSMINDMLDLSRIESAEMVLKPVDFDLGGLIGEMHEMFRPRCDEKELILHIFAFGNRRVPVRGDAGTLRLVLVNLLGNAVKFTNEGDITLKVRPAGDPAEHRYRFDVIDTGPGITETEREEIFRPFHQSDEGRKLGGTGLGLAITVRQVALMGGRLELESTPGRGTRFHFQIQLPPAEGELEDAGPVRSREILGLREGCEVNALVVDDQAESRDLLARLLAGIGCQVRTAEDAYEAFDRVREAMPDVVFMDRRMPDIDGVEAARQLIREHGSDRMKFIVMTVPATESEKAGERAAEFRGVLEKPFRLETVCEALRRCLSVEFEYAEEKNAESATVAEMDRNAGVGARGDGSPGPV